MTKHDVLTVSDISVSIKTRFLEEKLITKKREKNKTIIGNRRPTDKYNMQNWEKVTSKQTILQIYIKWPKFLCYIYIISK